jgi:putative transcriptional regulator
LRLNRLKAQKMTKAGERVLRGAREALAFAQGDKSKAVVHVPLQIDVRAIREGMNLTQAAFAARFGFSVRTLEQWESGRRFPQGPSRALLLIIAKEPKAAQRAMAAE